VALIGLVALVLAAPFGRWLRLRPVGLAVLMATIAVMTIWLVVRTVQVERRNNPQE
jgi:hypothetical protein